MNVQLLHHAPLSLVVTAIRRCYLSEGKSDSVWTMGEIRGYDLGPKDRALIERVIRDGHTSTLKTLNYCFDIDGLSRAALQELARHRHASLSVQSTRYTLGIIKDKDSCRPETFCGDEGCTSLPFLKRVTPEIDAENCRQLCVLKSLLQQGLPSDRAEYGIPAAFLTSPLWTVNARSLRNFLYLRTSKQAPWEMRELAWKVFAALPDDHQFIFADCMEMTHENL